MTLTKTSTNPEAKSSVSDWSGEINGKQFRVQIDSAAAPHWYDSQLDEYEQSEVLDAIEDTYDTVSEAFDVEFDGGWAWVVRRASDGKYAVSESTDVSVDDLVDNAVIEGTPWFATTEELAGELTA